MWLFILDGIIQLKLNMIMFYSIQDHWVIGQYITPSVVSSFSPDLLENVSIFPVDHLYRCWFSRHYNEHQSPVVLLCFLVVVILLLVGLS